MINKITAIFSLCLLCHIFCYAQDTTIAANRNANHQLTQTDDTNLGAYEARDREQAKTAHSHFNIGLFRPNYLLPFYNTFSPKTTDINPPDNQTIKQKEVKYQISLMFPIWQINQDLSLNLAYTQLSYWQVYTDSPYFRETNYQPEGFVRYQVNHWLTSELGVVHQSNGRGGQQERSWNRTYLNLVASGKHWFISVKPWLLIMQSSSSDLHNPDITDYLGHGRIVMGYKFHQMVLSIMSRNNLESGFKRGAINVTLSTPVFGHVRAYAEFFSGYGQSLIEYNHYTNAIGIGIALNDWI